MISIDSLIIPFIKKRIPKIAKIHRSNYAYNKKNALLKSIIINKYDRVILLNYNEKDYYRLNNLAVIPNFVDDEKCKKIKLVKKDIIIFAGRIVREKQLDHLVDIWSLINSKNLNWEVHVYGDGNIKSLQEKIVEKKVEQSFKVFAGTPEIKNKMEEAKIFVLVSKSEAFPMVLLEAMQARLPIVSYDSPHGPKNIVSDGEDGFIVSLNDKIAFAEKLDLLINNGILREKFIQNQKNKLDVFSKKSVMNQWNDLVLELLYKKTLN